MPGCSDVASDFGLNTSSIATGDKGATKRTSKILIEEISSDDEEPEPEPVMRKMLIQEVEALPAAAKPAATKMAIQEVQAAATKDAAAACACASCGAASTEKKMYHCQGCQREGLVEMYCSGACQRSAWPTHKLTCPSYKAKLGRKKKGKKKKPAVAAAAKKEKSSLDDLKICPSCMGMAEITETYEVKCGMTSSRPSGLTRSFTKECPTCEGEGYLNKDRHKLYMSGGIKGAAPAVQYPEGTVGAGAGGAEVGASGSDTYAQWKAQMEPEKRAEFDAQIAEANAA